MKLSDKVYTILKWVAIIALPALGTFYNGLALAWDLPYADQIPKTLDLIGTLLGILIGASCYNYNKIQNVKDNMSQ